MARGRAMRNLALLGGLGAAAMMAMKGRKKGEEGAAESEGRTAGPQTYADMPRGEAILDETGRASKFRRNPETGQLYEDVLGDLRTRAQEASDDEKIFRATGIRPRAAMRKGGKVKKMAAGGSASKRADGIAQRGKTRGKVI